MALVSVNKCTESPDGSTPNGARTTVAFDASAAPGFSLVTQATGERMSRAAMAPRET